MSHSRGVRPLTWYSCASGGTPARRRWLVNDEDAFVGVREPHRSCADPIAFRLGLARRHKYGLQRILRAGFVTEMQLRQVAPSLGEGLEIRRKRDARQPLRQIVGEPFPVFGGMKDSVNVVEDRVLRDHPVAVMHAECVQGGVGDVVGTHKVSSIIQQFALSLVSPLVPVSRKH